MSWKQELMQVLFYISKLFIKSFHKSKSEIIRENTRKSENMH